MLEIGSGGLDRINGIIRRQWKVMIGSEAA